MDNFEAQEKAMREHARGQDVMNPLWQTRRDQQGIERQGRLRSDYFANLPQYRNTKSKAHEPWVTRDRLYMASLTIIVVLHLIRDAGLL